MATSPLSASAPASVLDIQKEVALVLSSPSAPCVIGDLNSDGVCNILDIQLLISAIISPPPGFLPYIAQFTWCLAPLGRSTCNLGPVSFYQLLFINVPVPVPTGMIVN